VTIRQHVSLEELVQSNILIVQALVEVLGEKGVIDQADVLRRIEKLKHETTFTKSPQHATPEPSADTRTMVVSVDDLIASNMMAVEALLAILVDKAFLTQGEVNELMADLRKKTSAKMRKQ
jgi:hypothetical protein